jgi:hypothetical protein
MNPNSKHFNFTFAQRLNDAFHDGGVFWRYFQDSVIAQSRYPDIEDELPAF